MSKNKLDIIEDDSRAISPQVLNILLKDRTTEKNIVWATDEYVPSGFAYDDPITVSSVTGFYGNVLKSRTEKTKEEQYARTREKAEIFTPSWVCNKQNNLIDHAWFGRESVFNVEKEKGWEPTEERVRFPAEPGKTWQDYLLEQRMEVACGEAPYLVSRYDAVSGRPIETLMRIGLLDRKLRVLSENINGEVEWVSWAYKAFKSIYGYDWQGDNVLLSRENLLFTFIDYYVVKFQKEPAEELLLHIAFILSWNVWQMDGLKCVIPNSCNSEYGDKRQVSLFDAQQERHCEGCAKGNPELHTGVYCKVMDWDADTEIEFVALLNRDGGGV